MHINRGLLFWGLAFVTAGAVALGVQQGLIPRAWVTDAWRFWPVILIAIGISIIAARTPLAPLGSIVAALLLGTFVGGVLALGPGFVASCGGSTGAAVPTQTRDGSFEAQARVELDANCATLTITTQAGNAWSFAGSGDGDASIEASTDRVTIQSPDSTFFGGESRRRQWNVVLPTDPTLELSIDANAASSRLALGDAKLSKLDLGANAGDAHLDLSDARVDGLNIEVNAGSASVVLNERSVVSGSLSANAGSLQVCAPSSVALQITTDDNVAFSDNLDKSGLQAVDGNTWRSSNYETAAQRVTLSVDGNAGNFTLNPEGGCE